jgi:hypothetical protein
VLPGFREVRLDVFIRCLLTAAAYLKVAAINVYTNGGILIYSGESKISKTITF